MPFVIRSRRDDQNRALRTAHACHTLRPYCEVTTSCSVYPRTNGHFVDSNECAARWRAGVLLANAIYSPCGDPKKPRLFPAVSMTMQVTWRLSSGAASGYKPSTDEKIEEY